MRNKSAKCRIYIFVLVVVLIIACFGCLVVLNNWLSKNVENDIVEVYVNGEALYTYEVDDTLKVNPELDRDEIIESTIDEMLIVQYAREKQIEIADDEINYVLKVYQEHFPEIYREAINGYGEEGLKSGIKNRLLLSAAIEKIMEEPEYKIDLSEEAIWQYLLENGIDPATLDEGEYEEAKELYQEARKVENKELWVIRARQSAKIIYGEE